jgi:heptose I phosphotransferase
MKYESGRQAMHIPKRIILNDEFKNAWAGKDPFAEAFQLEGEIFRSVKTRRTFRFELNGRGYFAKIHHGIGWGEIVKNLLQFKRPVLGARNEYEAIRRLEKLGVATMKVAAFGARGRNPAKIESFIITEELTNTVSLEDFCRNWKAAPPPFALKLALIRYVAEVSRTLHRNGVNHRDYYICHFLLKTDMMPEILAPLIDLHRAQLRRETPRRWAVKDVAGLYFSVMGPGLAASPERRASVSLAFLPPADLLKNFPSFHATALQPLNAIKAENDRDGRSTILTQRDLFRFMKIYSGKTLRETLERDARFWRAVERTAERLYAKELRKPKG